MTSPTSKAAQTPVMQQYLREKARHPDALLFFRMGDFYELFFEDAHTAAAALDLALTSRNKNAEDSIPMAGVPHHAVQSYVARLLELGHKVALCEQLEDPAKAKGVVKRGVVRVLSPALVLDEENLDARNNTYLAAAVPPDGGPELPAPWAFAAYDLTTGELFSGDLPDALGLLGELSRLEVRELVCPPEAETFVRALLKPLPRLFVRTARVPPPREAAEGLARAFGEGELKGALEGSSVQARAAAALALGYAREAQPGHELPLHRLTRYEPRDHVHLDETTLGHLELFRTLRGEKQGSLLHLLDQTVTAMGARRLRTWLAFPLQDLRRIRRRHDAVDALVTYPEVRQALRQALSLVTDLERLGVRCALGAATPRDLSLLRDGLLRVPEVLRALDHPPDAAEALKPLRAQDVVDDLRQVLAGSLADNPPASVDEGGLFRPGFDPELDRLRALAEDSRTVLLSLEQRERDRTKIASLKVRYNRVFGYYIEVTKANLHNVPRDYRRKQTVAGGERFTTEELSALETELLAAEEKSQELERQRFEELRARCGAAATRLARLANILADADALASLAEVAHRHDYTRPVVDDGTTLELRDARHPVAEELLDPGTFVPNDVVLDLRGKRLLLVTGPNMAGKSTLLRQVALCALLAQAGSFVPARSARIGRVDKVYTRVGASDDLSRGQSTFMVEMRETAAILRGASARSLILIDEIGRGTSTFDGLAIAWSVAEYLHDVVKARCLFATHYHELCALADARPHTANVNVSARETGDDIVFLHKLAEGGASRSYGVAVARLAGLPEPVLARARAVLKDLERGEGPARRPGHQPGLFEPRAAPVPESHPVLAAVEALDVDRLTPLDALHFVAQLKGILKARA